MLINEIKPGALLADYVRLYRIIDFSFPSSFKVPGKWYPPRPEHCLQFMTRDAEYMGAPDQPSSKRFNGAIFMGPQSFVVQRFPGANTLGFQVIFQPGAVHMLTGVDAHELADTYTSASYIFGAEVNAVNERLAGIRDYREMIRIVEDYLLQLVRKRKMDTHPVEIVTRSWLQKEGAYSADKLARAACLSPRQLDRKFHEWIGLSPKLFLQMARFDKAFRLKNRYPDRDWLSIALHLDYHDYQHLAKDYKLFTGYSPKQFFDIDNQAPERLLGDAEI